MKRLFCTVCAIVACASAFSQTGLLSAAELKYLKELTSSVIESSRIYENQSVSPDFGPNATGGTLIRPGGRDCYPAFWIRDYAMSLACGLIGRKEQLHMLRLTASTQCDQARITQGGSMIPLGAIADHIRIDDSRPIYFPGTYDYDKQGVETWGRTPPYSDQYFFIEMAYHYVVRAGGSKKILQETVNGITLLERLDRAFNVPPARDDTHIVYTTEHFRGVDFGFRDAQIITGYLSVPSIYKYKAARDMAELYELSGNRERASVYSSVADTLKRHIPRIFCDSRGMIRASTETGSQADVWATALAVYYGILEGEDRQKACRTLSNAYRDGTLAYQGNIRHILVSDDFNESTAWERSLSPKNTYQNGAYWGTPTGWVCYAISLADPESARKLAAEYIADLKTTDYRQGDSFGGPYECFSPTGHFQNPVYMTTVTCPLSVFIQCAGPESGKRPADKIKKR